MSWWKTVDWKITCNWRRWQRIETHGGIMEWTSYVASELEWKCHDCLCCSRTRTGTKLIHALWTDQLCHKIICQPLETGCSMETWWSDTMACASCTMKTTTTTSSVTLHKDHCSRLECHWANDCCTHVVGHWAVSAEAGQSINLDFYSGPSSKNYC